MSVQGKRDATVVIALPGACKRQKIVQWARSAVNQEDLRGEKGRKRLRAGEMLVRTFHVESILLLHTDTHSICSGAADL